MKRFYKTVSLTEGAGGYDVMLDGKPIKTPGRNTLSAVSKSLAEAVMAEWADQKENVRPETMPLTQLLNTQLDRVQPMRAELEDEILKYINTDLLCYRTKDPPALKERQAASWDPYLQWFADHYGHGFQTTYDLAALEQPAALHQAIKQDVRNMSHETFTFLQLVVPLSGSIILAVAARYGFTDARKLYEAMRVEEHYQAGLYNEAFYGPDPLQGKKEEAVQHDIENAFLYLALTAS